MQYMLLIYGETAVWEARSESEESSLGEEYGKLGNDLRAQGKLLRGDELQPVATATSVQVRDGKAIVSDGPFADTKEVLGGYYLIEAESLDEAIEWAERVPDARYGTIEVRPIVDHSGTGA
jgi:hypothetical protein